MTTSKNTNMVTLENVNMMKCQALKNYGVGNVCQDYIQRVDMVTSLFDYESEELETIVFAYVLDRARTWNEEAMKARFVC